MKFFPKPGTSRYDYIRVFVIDPSEHHPKGSRVILHVPHRGMGCGSFITERCLCHGDHFGGLIGWGKRAIIVGCYWRMTDGEIAAELSGPVVKR